MQLLQPATVVENSVKKIENDLTEYLLANPNVIRDYLGDDLDPIASLRFDGLSQDQLRLLISEAVRLACHRETTDVQIFKNDTYQVAMKEIPGSNEFPALIHLSIRRLDREPVRDWRDLQDIKNQLVGPGCEGIELYPAEERVVDTANQFHLWVIKDPLFRFPFGFQTGRKSQENFRNSKQREFNDY